MKGLLLAATLSVGIAAPVGAQTAPPVLSKLIGTWEGEGELFGRPATFSLTWSMALDHRFARLEFENRLVEPDGSARTVLRALAMYRMDDGDRLRGWWFDTRGEVLDLRAVASDTTLTTRWIAETEQGRTVYRVVDEDTLEVVDDVLDEEGWRRFGRATYRRATGGAGSPGESPRGRPASGSSGP